MTPEITKLAVKKAAQSSCTYKVSAIGINRRGEVIYKAMNKHRFDRPGGSVHAEMEVMLKAGPGLRTIIICRVGRNSDILPIDPCDVCQSKADELGIRIISIAA